MPLHPPRAFFFDLDGTLIDSFTDIGNAMNHVLTRHRLPTFPIEKYHEFVGNGLNKLIERALPDHQCDSKTIDEFVDEFRAVYQHEWQHNTVPYPGISDMLQHLAANHFPVAVLSNKSHNFTTAIVAALFPDIPFALVRGAVPEFPKKPAPDHALWMAAQLTIPPEKIWFVGDTKTDMHTAHHAGMTAVGAAWATPHPDELTHARAHVIYTNPAQILHD